MAQLIDGLRLVGEADIARAIAEADNSSGCGDPHSQCALGVCYILGDLIDKDLDEAIYWLSEAAGGDDLNAQAILGVLLSLETPQQDLFGALNWTAVAAKRGSLVGRMNFGLMYLEGEVLGKDVSKGLYWCEKAGQGGLPEAQILLANYYCEEREDNDLIASAYWCKKAAAAGLQSAKLMLAIKYLYGTGLDKDPEYAQILLSRLSAEGSEDAKSILVEEQLFAAPAA